MENTTQVQVIREFIDRQGNRYPARKEPYLYGELPIYIRDNKDFVVPTVQTVLSTEHINPDSRIRILNGDSERRIEAVVLTANVVDEEVVPQENEVVVEEIVVEKKDEEPVFQKPTTSRKRKG
ncbi:hypothetical protein [Scytonema sp. NUACC26]|uniref:hypothetical protein n=1 Tax=Scytonema sp. NUACC26 TaxID=3140176 RepID=UPI0034DC5A93